jgi:hypothetical protein
MVREVKANWRYATCSTSVCSGGDGPRDIVRDGMVVFIWMMLAQWALSDENLCEHVRKYESALAPLSNVSQKW